MGHGYPGVAIADCCYQTFFVGRRDACVAAGLCDGNAFHTLFVPVQYSRGQLHSLDDRHECRRLRFDGDCAGHLHDNDVHARRCAARSGSNYGAAVPDRCHQTGSGDRGYGVSAAGQGDDGLGHERVVLIVIS